jgi:hypothetical protein
MRPLPGIFLTVLALQQNPLVEPVIITVERY